MRVEIVNWDKFNGRHDVKSSSWFRLQNDFWVTLFDLSNDQKMVWVMLLGLASRKMTGGVDVNISFIAVNLRLTDDLVTETLTKLETMEMIKIVATRPRNAPVTHTLRTRTATDGRTDELTDERTRPVTDPAAPAVLALKKKARAAYRFDDADMKAARWFQAEVKRGNPLARMVDRANLEGWANDIRLLREKHDITWEDLGKVMAFALLDDFWGAVVQSPTNVKKNWDKITAKMGRPAKSSNAGGFMGGIQS